MKLTRRSGLLVATAAALLLSTAGPASAAARTVAGAPGGTAAVPGDVSVVPSAQGVNVMDITPDTITLTSGDTYVYSVDTPEGQGRTTLEVRTVHDLVAQLDSRTGAAQSYVVTGADGAAKSSEDRVVPGDVLRVSAHGDVHAYTIRVVKGATR